MDKINFLILDAMADDMEDISSIKRYLIASKITIGDYGVKKRIMVLLKEKFIEIAYPEGIDIGNIDFDFAWFLMTKKGRMEWDNFYEENKEIFEHQ